MKSPSIFKLIEENLLWIPEPDKNCKIPTPHLISNKFKNARAFTVPFGIDEIDSLLPNGGLSFGATHEWFISLDAYYSPPPFHILGKLLSKALLKFKGKESRKDYPFLIWIGKTSWPNPIFLKRLGLLECSLFIDPPNQKLCTWAIEAALRSASFPMVIAACDKISFPLSRRFSLAAKRGNSFGILLRDKKELHISSSASTRWLAAPFPSPSLHPKWKLELIQCKGGKPPINSWTIRKEREF